MSSKKIDLCKYRFNVAEETYQNAQLSMDNNFFKDANNRAYYSVFYAIKSVLALEETDFQKHKTTRQMQGFHNTAYLYLLNASSHSCPSG